MLNVRMNKREFLLFVITALVVYGLYHFISGAVFINSNSLDSHDLINNKQVSPQELYEHSWKMIKNNYIDSSCNSQNWNRWKKRYNGKLKTDEDARVAIETMVASLDDSYTRFLSKKEYEEQYHSIDSHITGIGVNIMNQSGKTVICSVIEGTPAEKSGLRANDIIMDVNGKSVGGMDIVKVSELVRGPENSIVVLRIKRGTKFITKRIQRKKIEIKSVETSIKPNNIGYIKIKSFIGSNTAPDFMKAIRTVQNTQGVIIDLRGNTGGLLTNAVIAANVFMDEGKIVSIVSKSGRKRDINAQMTGYALNKPTVVLVDGGSASASEILSGALKDNKKAVLVGTKTFGKGLVQQIVPMPNGTGLNITIAKYLTPNGTDINKKGIEPDYVVDYTLADLKKHNDVQLKKAEEIITGMIKK